MSPALARCLGCVLVAAAVLFGVPGEGQGGQYVALGDSYTAGSGIPAQLGVPIGCERSDRNYPSLVRAALRSAAFRDVSCGGATTTNLTTPQPVTGGANPPQLDALSPGTALVTVGIGANDIGFAELVTTCTARSPTRPPDAACRADYQRGGRDELADRVAAAAPKVAAALRGIGERAPHARVLVIGYPTILPPGGLGCAPISGGDAGYLHGTFRALNLMLRAEAERAGARFVDVEAGSAGHDVCQPPGVKWVEGSVATAPAAPWHPNAVGMRHTAARVLDAVRRWRRSPRPASIRRSLR